MKKHLTFSNILILSAIIVIIVNSVIRYHSNQSYKQLRIAVEKQNKIEAEFTNCFKDLDTSAHRWEKTVIKMNEDRKQFLGHLNTCNEKRNF